MGSGHKKMRYSLGHLNTKCPACDSQIIFSEKSDSYGIEVNIESDKQVYIPGMIHLWRGCKNPMCGWSKVEGSF